MRLRNLAYIVLAASVSCSPQQQPQPDYNALRLELEQLKQQTKEGKALFGKYCAGCHGEYAEGSKNEDGSDKAVPLQNRKTGEMAPDFVPPNLVHPPYTEGTKNKIITDYLIHLSDKIKKGGTYMPPTTDFPHDSSGNPKDDELKKLEEFILNADRLKYLMGEVDRLKIVK